MAERIALLGRASLQSLIETVTVSRICSSVFIRVRSTHCAASKVVEEEEEVEVEQRSNKKKGKWVTLPPFVPTIDGASLGKELSRVRTSNRRDEIPTTSTSINTTTTALKWVDEIPTTSTSINTTTTALKWVLRCCPQVPRCLVQKLFRLRQVRKECVNSTSTSDMGTEAQEHRLKRVSAKDAMNTGDRIFLPVSVEESPSEEKKPELHYNYDEENYMHSLELYKDPCIIVFNKPHGMPVQGGIGIKKSLDMLASTYLRHEYSEPPRLVHRLDRDSSGVLVMGRTQTSATILHSLFREKTFGASVNDPKSTKRVLNRKYWALVIGTPKRAGGLISAPLGKVVLDNGKSERITIVDDTRNDSAQHAVTEYRVITSPLHGFTWIELSPLTGRKHQLRVHCAEVLGTPIVGDYKYGWAAHKTWTPVPWSNPEGTLFEKLPKRKMRPFNLDLESGSISEKEPHLHLHCRQLVLPNVAQALQHVQSASYDDLSKVESLDFVAPLPLHMQRSWDILNS